MQSLRELYRYGMGSSSSHTMEPGRAAEWFREHHPQTVAVRVTSPFYLKEACWSAVITEFFGQRW